MHKAHFLGHPRPVHHKRAGMGIQQRLTAAMGLAAPWQQLTPDQQFFRQRAEGRAAASVEYGAHAPAHRISRHPDGTCDLVGMDPEGSSWIDLGGKGGRDVAVGRP
jgi:hypothetical protein